MIDFEAMSDPKRAGDLDTLALLADPVRRRLYEWVVAQGEPVGRERVATATGVSRGLAAFHLDKLAEAGLLEAAYRRLTGRVGPGAGRPARVYWRSSRELQVSIPERRYRRAAELFASALERLGHGEPPRELADGARDIGRELAARDRRGSGRTRLMKALTRGGYEPMTDPSGTVRLRNCPFDALVDDHRPLVCGTNLALAEGLQASTGPTGLQPVLDPQPGYCCVAFVPAGGER